MAGWERPGRNGSSAAGWMFEAVWSVDPQVVRDAARMAAALAASAMADLPSRLTARLGEQAGSRSPELGRAGQLLERTIDYLSL